MMRRPVTAWLPLCLLLPLAAACGSNDIGKSCTPKPMDPLPSEPVGGEHPANEIVAMQRSGDCETFMCLTARGYPPYCSRTCQYDSSTKKGPCTTNAQCKRPLHCFEGVCQDDDCPSGFECRTIEDVGPEAGKLFCVQKEGCANNLDCEALGQVDCRHVGCFNAQLMDATALNALTCLERDKPGQTDPLSFCQCTEGDTCTYPACDPIGADPWPAESVELRSVCVRK
jgi:hypothetical protein